MEHPVCKYGTSCMHIHKHTHTPVFFYLSTYLIFGNNISLLYLVLHYETVEEKLFANLPNLI